MVTFLSITSDGGNFGRLRWVNRRPVEIMGKRGTGWGFFWFGEPPWKDESPRHISCRCTVIGTNKTGRLIPAGTLMTTDCKPFPLTPPAPPPR
jgi:hypothetical protein